MHLSINDAGVDNSCDADKAACSVETDSAASSMPYGSEYPNMACKPQAKNMIPHADSADLL